MTEIGDAVRGVRERLEEHPTAARSPDSAAAAVVDGGLRCRIEAPDGSVLFTDMPTALGGEASAPTPGWLARAARASCLATMIALRAAELGLELEGVRVLAESESDLRGMLGLEDDVPPGPVETRLRVEVEGPRLRPDEVNALVAWAERHSPVSDLVTRAVPSALAVEPLTGAQR
jgi:uncharacterized OsmC-like protein